MNPALDCGIDPNDSLLVAYLPKLDTVLQERYKDNEIAYELDGMVVDISAPKPVKWWKVRRYASYMRLALPYIIWQDKAKLFHKDFIADFAEVKPEPDMKLYMRAYSHGPWICIEDEQLKKVYGDNA